MATIQWYPGHIASAERQLKKELARVDVILEVLDARIPQASQHPQLPQWAPNKPRLIVLNRMDQITPAQLEAWLQAFPDREVFPTNAQQGQGVAALKTALIAQGAALNARRQQRGMQARAVRAAVLGFPNVGKSALLNRLLNRRAVASANRPGVTRQLRWVRIGGDLDMLDAPGILPPMMNNQVAAVRLAICDDIGAAAYVNEHVAADLLDLLAQLDPGRTYLQRYGEAVTHAADSEAVLTTLAAQQYHDDRDRAASAILNDYRKGYLGALGLENPPMPAAGHC
ncbi:MAG: ribosome biogenesis GTPase YlqF [Synechococcaceae cyanobacterium SM2_3_60]|nr:ribosome biogenesis GTPase YlqF [Synechococcaceae cyanobacterium SM2_3_60]